MQTYNYKTFFNESVKIMKSLMKKRVNALSEIKNKWFLMPDYLQKTTIHSLKNNTLFLYTKDNALFLQYKEREILKECQKISTEIQKIKILQA